MKDFEKTELIDAIYYRNVIENPDF